jgi:hypothetical protein
MLYKVEKNAIKVLQMLFGSPCMRGENQYPQFQAFSLSRRFIRNYSLHPLIRLWVAKDLDMREREFFLQVAKNYKPVLNINLYVGNWSEVKNQFQYEEIQPKENEIDKAEVIIFVSHDHATGGSAHSIVDSYVEPISLQQNEGLHSHWVNRYIWIVPSGEKTVAKIERTRSGWSIHLGDDSINISNQSAFYFAESYGSTIDILL